MSVSSRRTRERKEEDGAATHPVHVVGDFGHPDPNSLQVGIQPELERKEEKGIGSRERFGRHTERETDQYLWVIDPFSSHSASLPIRFSLPCTTPLRGRAGRETFAPRPFHGSALTEASRALCCNRYAPLPCWFGSRGTEQGHQARSRNKGRRRPSHRAG